MDIRSLNLTEAQLEKAFANGRVNVSWRDQRTLTQKQRKVLDVSMANEAPLVLYGGSGFSGKSYLLRSAFVEFNGVYKQLGFPGQWGALFCQTYNDLQNRHLNALNSELSHLGRVKESAMRGLCFEFNDPSMGGLYLRNIADPDKYRGAEFPYILVDELTELKRSDFDDLLYALRSPLPLPFKPFLAGSNPDGIGHSFVKKLWVSRDFEDESLDGDRFFFVKALPQDNPTYSTSKYEQTLQSLPEWKRKARFEGSWDAPAGARFPNLDPSIHQFSEAHKFPKGFPNPKNFNIIMGVDWGKAAPFAALWIAVDENQDMYVYREAYYPDLSSDSQVKLIMEQTNPNEKVFLMYCDSQMWEKRRDPHYQSAALGPSAVDVYMRYLRTDKRFGYPIKGYKGLRRTALDTIDRLLDRNNDFPNLYIGKTCKNLWRELTGAVWAKSKGVYKEDISDKCDDHAITALYYALHTFIRGADVEPQPISDEELRRNRIQEIEELEAKEFRKMVRNYKKTGMFR